MKKATLLLSIVLIIMSMNIAAYADGPSGAKDVEYTYTQQELDELDKLRKEAWDNYSRFIGTPGARYYPDGYYKTLSVSVFEQPNSYYCGPATTKQVTHFLNGYSDTMENIAVDLETDTSGTILGNIKTYLNDNTNENYNIEWDTRDYYTWLSQMYSSIDNDKPAVLLIAPKTSMGFPYSSSGHYVNTSGMDSKYSHTNMLRITDPWEKGLGNKWYEARDVYDALRNHTAKAMIY